MDQLSKTRLKINDIDKQMAALFEERMEAVEDVIRYKKEHGMAILDTSREAEVIERNLAYIKKADYRDSYRLFIEDIMGISRKYQKAVLNRDTIGYAGTLGAFSNIASIQLFPDAKQVAYPGFEDVFKAVINNEIRYGIIPFENSYTGEVGEVLDLL